MDQKDTLNTGFQILYSSKAKKFLKTQSRDIVIRIKNAIKGLLHNPPDGDIAPLNGYADGRMRLRVGSFRVIYRFERSAITVLLILDIGNRGDIYKKKG